MDLIQLALPAHDIRRFLSNICKHHVKLDSLRLQNILTWYHIVNPLTRVEWEVVKINLLFPYKILSKVTAYYQYNRGWDEELYEKVLLGAIKREENIYSSVSHEYDNIINQLD